MTIMSIVMIMGMLVTMMKMRMMLIKKMMIVITVMTDLIVAERRMTVRVRQVMHRAQRQDTYLVASYTIYGGIEINTI